MQEVFAEEEEEEEMSVGDEVETECESVVQGTDVEEAMERQGLVRLVQKEKDPTPPPFIIIDGRVHRRVDAAEPFEEEDVESSGSEWFPASEELPSLEDSVIEEKPHTRSAPEEHATSNEEVAVEVTTPAKSQTRTPAPKRRQKTTYLSSGIQGTETMPCGGLQREGTKYGTPLSAGTCLSGPARLHAKEAAGQDLWGPKAVCRL
ncbi:uncharacterized protein LOC123530409 [Mercenaria mercenaria]|uniref:uncharacterized protein LOC123530409 n=1 Tax=Mercenaria mercenaria TaxID=6596 RepID=UPI00234E4025|nr:uncharacterized protein LOC123530409 [Mercenaria mercenaria]